ncbi:MAG: DUF1569 domain-containing protein [Ferruginibacter sp.]
MITEKAAFLREGMFDLLKDFSEEHNKKWGKLNAQQMLEHVRDFFMVSTGDLSFDLVTPEEQLPKYREFLLSDKEFRENTKAPASVLGEEPLPLRFNNLEAASQALKESVERFFKYFEEQPGITTMHPVFGNLNSDDWILLHYKHVRHHFRQFGLLKEG